MSMTTNKQKALDLAMWVRQDINPPGDAVKRLTSLLDAKDELEALKTLKAASDLNYDIELQQLREQNELLLEIAIVTRCMKSRGPSCAGQGTKPDARISTAFSELENKYPHILEPKPGRRD